MDEKKKTLASLCKKAYACRDAYSYCRPAYPIDGDTFYFVGQGEQDCPYQRKYGSLYTCGCPVRLEIYQRYKL